MSQPAESAQMFTIVDHPLVGMKMTTLRDQRTPPQQFRRTLHEIAGLMSFHVFAHLRCDARDVNTPLETTTGQYLQSPVPCLLSILLAGNGLLDALSACASRHTNNHCRP